MCDLFLNLYICIDDGRCMADKIGNDYPHKLEKNARYFMLFESISIKHQEEVHIFRSPLIEFGLLSNVYICCLSIFLFCFCHIFYRRMLVFRFHFRSYNIEPNTYF